MDENKKGNKKSGFYGLGEKSASGKKTACTFARRRGGQAKLERKDFTGGPAKRVRMGIISESLGHTTLKTTQVYLKDFENEVLDEVNELVVT